MEDAPIPEPSLLPLVDSFWYVHICFVQRSPERDTELQMCLTRADRGEISPPLTCWQCSS